MTTDYFGYSGYSKQFCHFYKVQKQTSTNFEMLNFDSHTILKYNFSIKVNFKILKNIKHKYTIGLHYLTAAY